MPTVTLRFQKCDEYNNVIFIANSKTEEKEFKSLKKIHIKLEKIHGDIFLPIYTHGKYQYSTLRIQKITQLPKLNVDDVCKISYEIRKKNREQGVLIYWKLNKFELISSAAIDDLIEFSNDDDVEQE